MNQRNEKKLKKENAQIKQMRQAGISVIKIGKEMKLPVGTVYSRMSSMKRKGELPDRVNKGGEAPPLSYFTNDIFTTDIITAIIPLYMSGLPASEIANKFGVCSAASMYTKIAHLRKYGLIGPDENRKKTTTVFSKEYEPNTKEVVTTIQPEVPVLPETEVLTVSPRQVTLQDMLGDLQAEAGQTAQVSTRHKELAIEILHKLII